MDDLAPFTAHGGRVAAARARFGGEDWIDLSTGIAPWPYPAAAPPGVLERLPEPAALAALEDAARAAFGVGDAEVVAVPGTDLAMRLLATLIPAASPARLEPGYAGHRAAWPDAAPWTGGRHDLLVLANPNNPDGRVFERADLLDLARTTTLVVDEAYADAAPGRSLADAAGERIVVLRSFGKFYGLAGVRLGFVIAHRNLAERLRALLGDWPIAQPALAIGTAAYRDAAWRTAQQARIAAMGARLDAVLAGREVVGATPFFRLIAAPDAHALFRRLARHAILTRPFAAAQDRLRIGLPADEAGLARLAAALEEPA